jgi:RimJ/RimL family protein N-acetyltransferase
MTNIDLFTLKVPGYSVESLELKDAEQLQKLYEKCADYAYLVDGQAPSPTAAREEFFAVPEGKSLCDKFMFGLFDSRHELIGLIESIRCYPDDQTWWVGLIMLDPKYRRKGLLNPIMQSFEHWVAKLGMCYIMGSVVEANVKVLRLWKRMGFEVICRKSPKQFNQKSHSIYVIRRDVIKLSSMK